MENHLQSCAVFDFLFKISELDFYKWHIYYVCFGNFFVLCFLRLLCDLFLLHALQLSHSILSIIRSCMTQCIYHFKNSNILYNKFLFTNSFHFSFRWDTFRTHSNVKLNCIVFEIFLCWAQLCIALGIYCRCFQKKKEWKIPRLMMKRKTSVYCICMKKRHFTYNHFE